MGDAKSQFVLGGYTGNNYLLDSLSILGEDTRGGLNGAAATRLNAMADYVAANPEKTNPTQFQAYRAKLTAASAGEPGSKPTVGPRGSKPGNGIM